MQGRRGNKRNRNKILCCSFHWKGKARHAGTTFTQYMILVIFVHLAIYVENWWAGKNVGCTHNSVSTWWMERWMEDEGEDSRSVSMLRKGWYLLCLEIAYPLSRRTRLPRCAECQMSKKCKTNNQKVWWIHKLLRLWHRQVPADQR